MFTAFVFLMLWLLQTVFLQGLYDRMIIRNTKKAAAAAAEEIAQCADKDSVQSVTDNYAANNSLLIYVVDGSDLSIYAISDEFTKDQRKLNNRQDWDPLAPGQMWNDGRSLPPEASGDPAMQSQDRPDMPNGRGEWGWKRGERSELPVGGPYQDSLRKMTTRTDNSPVESREEEIYVYACDVNYCGTGTAAFLLVGTKLNTVGASVRVIRVQLIWATVISLLFGFAISWFLSRKFSGPVGRLSEKARKLGDREYSADYPQGFCSELDELSDTLDRTNDKLIISRNFQTELMANVSHDLRTPLTMIKGYAEMITDISIDDPDQCKKDMQVIVKEADRLTALVNEILAYSELQASDKLEYSTQVDLSKLTAPAIESFNTLGKPGGITVESEIADDIIVDGSRSHLERVLYNLMENAVRHTGERKTIHVALRSEGDLAKLSVTDYGDGIPAEELEHIWDRYYTARQRGGQGVSGLGLAIVKQIVSLHGGRCDVTSEPGKGSTFTVSLRTVT